MLAGLCVYCRRLCQLHTTRELLVKIPRDSCGLGKIDATHRLRLPLPAHLLCARLDVGEVAPERLQGTFEGRLAVDVVLGIDLSGQNARTEPDRIGTVLEVLQPEVARVAHARP